MTTMESDVYYDPYDFDIDSDPYPVWRRLRDEQPLYFNERYDFYALSRFDDVDRCSRDWETYISGKGTLLEIIKSGMELPPGSIIFEDPPAHHLHRRLLSRVFTPRNINGLEPKIREFCARSLDPLVDQGGFDFIADLGAQMPMRTIGMLLGIPEPDQEAIRDRIDDGLRLTESGMPDMDKAFTDGMNAGDGFAEYIDWRATHPSDDLMTELLNAEFEDETGTVRRLTREEVLGLRQPPGRRRQRDHHPPHRVDRQGAGRPSRPAPPSWSRTAAWCRTPSRNCLRYESPSPVQARYVTKDVEHYGQAVPAGSAILLLTAAGNRDERQVPRRRPVRRPPQDRPPSGLRLRDPLLPRIGAGQAGGAHRPRRGPAAVSRPGRSTGRMPCRPGRRRYGVGSKLPVFTS